MNLRSKNGWELWGNCHPSSLICDHAGGKDVPCDCPYHVVASDRSKMHSFHSFAEAEDKFVNLSGAAKFVIGKTRWD